MLYLKSPAGYRAFAVRSALTTVGIAGKLVHGADLHATPFQIQSAPSSMNLEENIMQTSTNNTMETETASWTDSAAESGKGAVQALEEAWGAIGRGTWHVFHALPGHGTIPGFAVGLGAAMLVGVAELATACFTAYVSYRVFAYGESLSEAIENAIKFESGKLEKEELIKPIPD
jgi:hypothetical protein